MVKAVDTSAGQARFKEVATTQCNAGFNRDDKAIGASLGKDQRLWKQLGKTIHYRAFVSLAYPQSSRAARKRLTGKLGSTHHG